jgi:two-component sensor histidine kinase
MSRRGETDTPNRGNGRPSEEAVHRVWLSGGHDAPAGARAALDLLTVEHFAEDACEQLRLMISELVSNSVLHGGARGLDDSIELTILLSELLLRVECADPVGGFDPPPSPTDPRRPSGYGLTVIGSLASAWGTRHGDLGSTWFEFSRA